MDLKEIMSLGDCIRVFENCQLHGAYAPGAMTAAYVNALAAMHEKAERERPLTLAELEAVPYGEPVYIIHANGQCQSGWGIKARDPGGHGNAYLTIQGNERNRSHFFRPCAEFYGQTWTAYRNKPEGRKIT